MSDTDGFIEEVTEEVRRDRLFALMRRYGWIPVLGVVLLVGGATVNEVLKSRAQGAAEARGDAVLAALELPAGALRADALAAVEAPGAAAPLIAMLRASEEVVAGETGDAAEALLAVMRDDSAPRVYRDMATLKHTILTADETGPTARISALSALTTPGGVFRTLAEEQIALAEIEMGETEAAITRLQALMLDTEASEGLRARAQQLIVALGGEATPT